MLFGRHTNFFNKTWKNQQISHDKILEQREPVFRNSCGALSSSEIQKVLIVPISQNENCFFMHEIFVSAVFVQNLRQLETVARILFMLTGVLFLSYSPSVAAFTFHFLKVYLPEKLLTRNESTFHVFVLR